VEGNITQHEYQVSSSRQCNREAAKIVAGVVGAAVAVAAAAAVVVAAVVVVTAAVVV
jgi:hypothetical protein